METIENAKVIDYQNELIVELHLRNEGDEFSAITYQFTYGEPDTVIPKESIESSHHAEIESALEEAGYRFEVEPSPE